MNKSAARLLILSAILLPAALAFAGARASIADKGGCPNENSQNGASHANSNSAHGPEKQADRDCDQATLSTPGPTPVSELTPTPTSAPTPEPTPAPTPEPTPAPTPEPTPTATAELTPSPTASPEPTATPAPTDAPTPTPAPGADVQVVDASVISPANAGAGIQFVLTAGSTILNNGPVTPVIVHTTFTPILPASCSATTGVRTVQDTVLPVATNVFVSRSWLVTCDPGSQTFTVDVSVAIDAAQPYVDPNPANNAGSASSITEIN